MNISIIILILVRILYNYTYSSTKNSIIIRILVQISPYSNMNDNIIIRILVKILFFFSTSNEIYVSFYLKSIGQVFVEKSLKNYVLVIMLVHIFLRNHIFQILVCYRR